MPETRKRNPLFKVGLSLLLLLLSGWITSAMANDESINFTLTKAKQLRNHEEWGQLDTLTKNPLKVSCTIHQTACMEIQLMRAEALYGLRRPSGINEADKLILNIGRKIRKERSINHLDLQQALKIVYAKGLRQRPDVNLPASYEILSKLLTENLSPENNLRALGEIAYVLRQQGNSAQAKIFYNQLLEKSDTQNNEEGKVSAQIGLALLYFDEERYFDAINGFQVAISLLTDPMGHTKYNRRVAFLYGNLGTAYKISGDFKKALENYTIARSYLELIDSTAYRTHYLIEIASARRLLGDPSTALTILDKEYFPYAIGGFAYDYYALREKSLILRSMGDLDGASKLLREAINLRQKTGGSRKIGEYYAELALLELERGNPSESINISKNALIDAIKQEDARSEWKLTFALFEANRAAGNKREAIYWGKRSVNLLQTIRERLKLGSEVLQATYLKSVQYVFQRLADLMIEAGRIPEAEQVLAMLKEREYNEQVRSRATDSQKTLVEYLGRERRASDDLTKLAEEGVRESVELAELEKRIFRKEALTAAERNRREVLRANARSWTAQFDRYLDDLSREFSISERTLIKASIQDNSTLLQRKVSVDDAGAIGLQYVVNEDQVSIIVSTSRSSFGRTSAIKRTDLNQNIYALRQAMEDRVDPTVPAQVLWKALIEPVQKDIEAAGAKTLVLNLTDTLRYLPFAALLSTQGRYLIEDMALSLWTPAAAVSPSTSSQAWRVAAMGVTQAREGFSALPAVRSELLGIVKTDQSPQGVLPGHVELDESFDRRRLEEALDGGSNVVHIASHFNFKNGDNRASALLLGQGPPLSLEDLKEMNFEQIEQLTLSACETAKGGGINENGAEVESLATTALRQNAKSVLATLWKVADASTAQLMQDFYSLRAQATPLSRAQALRAAQLALLHGESLAPAEASSKETGRGVKQVNPVGPAPADVDPARPFAHPYFWAPFVLSGSWL